MVILLSSSQYWIWWRTQCLDNCFMPHFNLNLKSFVWSRSVYHYHPAMMSFCKMKITSDNFLFLIIAHLFPSWFVLSQSSLSHVKCRAILSCPCEISWVLLCFVFRLQQARPETCCLRCWSSTLLSGYQWTRPYSTPTSTCGTIQLRWRRWVGGVRAWGGVYVCVVETQPCPFVFDQTLPSFAFYMWHIHVHLNIFLCSLLFTLASTSDLWQAAGWTRTLYRWVER